MRALLFCLVLFGTTESRQARAQAQAANAPKREWVRTSSGLEYQIVAEGAGPGVRTGQTVTMHEALSLPDGRVVFDSRVAPNKPVTFTLGAKQVIPGVEEGVAGMRVGERRRLRVPPKLDGRKFDSSFIPPSAIRLYDITLLAINP